MNNERQKQRLLEFPALYYYVILGQGLTRVIVAGIPLAMSTARCKARPPTVIQAPRGPVRRVWRWGADKPALHKFLLCYSLQFSLSLPPFELEMLMFSMEFAWFSLSVFVWMITQSRWTVHRYTLRMSLSNRPLRFAGFCNSFRARGFSRDQSCVFCQWPVFYFLCTIFLSKFAPFLCFHLFI